MKRPKVIMIDEDKVACQAVEHVLSRRGVSSKVCVDPDEGLAELEKGGYAVVLLDMRLRSSDMNGLDVLRRIRSNERTKDIPVFFLSNAGLEHEIRTGLEAGADEYLVKTETPIAEIADRILRVIGKRED